MKEVIKKLNNHNNFHLSFKVIQISDDNLIDEIKEITTKKVLVLKDTTNLFEKLLSAYNNNIKHVVCNDKIDVLLPLVVFITNDNVDVIKPTIPVFYYLKDNKIIQKVKTQCNKTYTSYNNLPEGIITINEFDNSMYVYNNNKL